MVELELIHGRLVLIHVAIEDGNRYQIDDVGFGFEVVESTEFESKVVVSAEIWAVQGSYAV